jgi:transposase-like protein
MSRLLEKRQEVNMSVQQRRKYDPGVKKQAVLLIAEPGRSLKEVADNLGFCSDLIYR